METPLYRWKRRIQVALAIPFMLIALLALFAFAAKPIHTVVLLDGMPVTELMSVAVMIKIKLIELGVMIVSGALAWVLWPEGKSNAEMTNRPEQSI